MKFTKEEARKELVTRMTTKGEKLNLSDRSINEQLETLMTLLANDETELAAFIDSVLPVFKTADANVRNDVSEGIETYKKQNPANPDAKKKKDDKKTDEPDGNKELLDRISALEAQIAAGTKAQKISDLKKDFVRKLKEKGINDDEWIDGYLGEITIDEDFDVDTKAESCLKFYNKTMANSGDPQYPGKPNYGRGEEKRMNDFIKEAAKIAKTQSLSE